MKRIRIASTFAAALLFAVAARAGPKLAAPPNDPLKLVVQTGHKEEVGGALFVPKTDWIATASDDDSVRIWHAGTGRELRVLPAATSNPPLAATSDRSLLAVGGSIEGKGVVQLWDLRTEAPPRIVPGLAYGLAFSPDDATLATFTIDDHVRLFDVKTGAMRKEIELAEPRLAAFSPDGTLLAVATDHGLTLLRASDLTKVGELPSEHGASSLSFHPSGKQLVLAYAGVNYARIVEVSGLRVVKELRCDKCVARYSPDGALLALATTTTGKVELRDAAGERVVRELKPVGDWVNALAFDARGGQLLVAYNFHPAAILYDVASGAKVRSFEGHSRAVNQVAFSSDGAQLFALTGYEAASPSDFAFKTFRADLGRELPSRPLPSLPKGFAVSPDGQLVATATRPVVIFDARTGAEVARLPNHGHVESLAFSPDSRRLAIGRGYVIERDDPGAALLEVWDPRTGQRLQKLPGIKGGVYDVDFNADGTLLVAAGFSSIKDSRKTRYEARVFDLATSAEARLFSAEVEDGGHTARFLPGGKEILTDLDGNVTARRVADGRITRTIKKRSRLIAVSPDAEQLALFLHGTKGFEVVRARTGAKVATFPNGVTWRSCVAFSPDGKRLAVSEDADDTVIHLHELPSGKRQITLIPLDRTGWVAATPDGRFDGAPVAFPRLSWAQGKRSIALDAFFEQLYSPGLFAQVLAGEVRPPPPVNDAPKLDVSRGFALPPLVTLPAPAGGLTRTVEAVELTVHARDQGGGVEELRLYQNGKLLSHDTRGFARPKAGGTDVTQTFSVYLMPGRNLFHATALNTERTEAEGADLELVLQATRAAASDLYLVVVGIDAYKNGKYKLNYARKDATSFRDEVARRAKPIFAHIHEQLLLDDAASREGVAAALEQVKASARPQDSLIFYYAGHGVMSEGSPELRAQFFLIPPDITRLYGDDAALATRGISVDLLKEWVTAVKAQKQLIVLDACQSGGAVESFAMRGAAEEKAMLQLARSAGIVVLAATGTEQFANEVKDLGHGVFTYVLLEGMSGAADTSGGADGKVTVKELDAYLNDKVPELTKKFRGSAQYPNSFARGQDFPIGVSGGP